MDVLEGLERPIKGFGVRFDNFGDNLRKWKLALDWMLSEIGTIL